MKYQARFITKLDNGQEFQVECKEVGGQAKLTIAACVVNEDRDDTCLVLKDLSLEYVKEFANKLNNVIKFAEMG